MHKKGQMKLSFGMIFSIFLIIIFISFAFYAIKTFLGIQNEASTVKFVNDFKSDIDIIWKSTKSSQEFEYPVPLNIKHVCFADFSSTKSGASSELYDELDELTFGEGNFILYTGNADTLSIILANIDIETTTSNENPLCFKNSGKITLILKKELDEALVTIKRKD